MLTVDVASRGRCGAAAGGTGRGDRGGRPLLCLLVLLLVLLLLLLLLLLPREATRRRPGRDEAWLRAVDDARGGAGCTCVLPASHCDNEATI